MGRMGVGNLSRVGWTGTLNLKPRISQVPHNVHSIGLDVITRACNDGPWCGMVLGEPMAAR